MQHTLPSPHPLWMYLRLVLTAMQFWKLLSQDEVCLHSTVAITSTLGVLFQFSLVHLLRRGRVLCKLVYVYLVCVSKKTVKEMHHDTDHPHAALVRHALPLPDIDFDKSYRLGKIVLE